jgi:hypothetical protein
MPRRFGVLSLALSHEEREEGRRRRNLLLIVRERNLRIVTNENEMKLYTNSTLEREKDMLMLLF